LLKSPFTRRIWLISAGLLFLGGCANVSAPRDPRDPWESFNRASFQFNDELDRIVLKPVARAYNAVVPEFARGRITNFFSNIRDVKTLANDLWGLKIREAYQDLQRILFNSTFGLGGLNDVASQMRLPKRDRDFGLTLGYWGVKNGPYLVLPFFGPSTVRDAFGMAADLPYTPYPYLPDRAWLWGTYGLSVVSSRADLLKTTNVLEEAALDRYAFVRNAYLQRRQNQVYEGHPPKEKEEEEEESEPTQPSPPPSGQPAKPETPEASRPEPSQGKPPAPGSPKQ
jgi:phospholipid-binding lipoprotein MlaA